METNDPDALIQGDLEQRLREIGTAVLITDYQVARRQRLHWVWDPVTDESYCHPRLATVLEHAMDRLGPDLILIALREDDSFTIRRLHMSEF